MKRHEYLLTFLRADNPASRVSQREAADYIEYLESQLGNGRIVVNDLLVMLGEHVAAFAGSDMEVMRQAHDWLKETNPARAEAEQETLEVPSILRHLCPHGKPWGECGNYGCVRAPADDRGQET